MKHLLDISHMAIALSTLLSCTVADSNAQQLPSDAAIAKEADKQHQRSLDAIIRAEHQAARLHQPVPDVSSPTQFSAPDPAAIAQRYSFDPRTEDGLYILVSLSMPPETLERLTEQARKAGAPLVLRGITDGSLKRTLDRTADIVRKHPGAEVQIDPTLFRRFNVDEVPAFVMSVRPPDQATCGKNCDAANSYTLVKGDVSVDYALEHIAKQRNTRFAGLARERLKRFKETP